MERGEVWTGGRAEEKDDLTGWGASEGRDEW